MDTETENNSFFRSKGELGYCVNCKAKRIMKNTEEVEMKNHRLSLKGRCSLCDTGMFKILPEVFNTSERNIPVTRMELIDNSPSPKIDFSDTHQRPENKYMSYEELIMLIDSPNRQSCKQIYADNKKIFNNAHGSSNNHQAWKGGYRGHMEDIMNIAFRIYSDMQSVRDFPFSLSDALLGLFLHDIEKPWVYGGKKKIVADYDNYQDFQLAKIEEYGFELTDEHLNAIKYAHGEGDDYRNDERVSTPLAAFVHCCDTMSARIWFDQPKTKGW